MPKLTVIMSVYKENKFFLTNSIESILNQSFRDFEFLIVLDEPSNFHLKNIIQHYELQDKRIRLYINKKNMGLALSLNTLISESKGKYIARMDSDDISLPERFQKQIDFLDKNPDIALIGSNCYLIDEMGQILKKDTNRPRSSFDIKRTLSFYNCIVHPSTMMRTSAIKKISGYRNFATSQDYDLWLRFVDYGFNIVNLEECLIQYRINPNGISQKKKFLQFLNKMYISDLHHERLSNNNEDSYSEISLADYLTRNGFSEIKCANYFYKITNKYNSAKNNLRNKNIIVGLYQLICCLCCRNRLLRREYLRLIYAKLFLPIFQTK